MYTQTGITIWHQTYNPATRLKGWVKTYYDKASLYKDLKVSVLSNGLKSANVIIIRIPEKETINISNGDKIMYGGISSPTPVDEAYTVVEFSDNRKGSISTWHWKIICQ